MPEHDPDALKDDIALLNSRTDWQMGKKGKGIRCEVTDLDSDKAADLFRAARNAMASGPEDDYNSIAFDSRKRKVFLVINGRQVLNNMKNAGFNMPEKKLGSGFDEEGRETSL